MQEALTLAQDGGNIRLTAAGGRHTDARRGRDHRQDGRRKVLYLTATHHQRHGKPYRTVLYGVGNLEVVFFFRR